MKQNFLHFLSEVPCLVGINGKTIEKIDNEKIFECDIITNTSELFVSFTPTITNKTYIPYTYLLKTNDIPQTLNNQIKIIPFPYNNYDIIMKPFEISPIETRQVLCNKEVGKYFISIISGYKTNVTIFSGASIIFTHTIENINKVKVEYLYENIIIEGISNENYYLLIIKSDDMKILFESKCQSIEKDNDFIECLTNLNDISKTAEVNKISLKDQKIDRYYVYQFNEEIKPTSDILIPMNLLESIKIGDENVAKKLLSDNFNSATISTLSNYFGNFNEIYLNRHCNKVGIFNYTIKGNEYKNYDFIIENNKIIDIQEVEI